jgi:hypothetical protein
MSELLLSEDALLIPSGVEGKARPLDMRKIHKAEARLVELQGVTRLKAGELLYTFIDAFGEAKTHLAWLRGEYGRAKQRVREARGIVVLDKAADVLKAKGLASSRSPAGSEDLRDGVVNRDEEYKKVFDVFCQIEAAVEHMEGKVEKMKMAYYAISDLVKTADAKRDTSGGAGDDEPGAVTQSEKIQQFVAEHSTMEPDAYEDAGFGTPKY